MRGQRARGNVLGKTRSAGSREPQKEVDCGRNERPLQGVQPRNNITGFYRWRALSKADNGGSQSRGVGEMEIVTGGTASVPGLELEGHWSMRKN